MNDTEATLSMAEDGGGAQENEEMGGEGLQMEGAASGRMCYMYMYEFFAECTSLQGLYSAVV